jgi:hypothetical protein
MQSPRKRQWPGIVLALAVVVGAGLILVRESGATGEAAAVETGKAAGVETGTIGNAVTREGIFEYMVTSPDCSATVKGAVAKGRFCAVGITVRNVGSVSRTPGISFATVIDAQGGGHLPDAVAQVRSGSSLLDALGPGARISDRLIYDMPKTATISSILLRESPPSAGITVALS